MIHEKIALIFDAHKPNFPVISEIRIQNFKSIQDLTLKPGRVTVLIGANGSGKSNILEGIAFAAGAAADRLDNVFLTSLGIRVTDEAWMRSAFPNQDDGRRAGTQPINLLVKGSGNTAVIDCRITPRFSDEDERFTGWRVHAPVTRGEVGERILKRAVEREIASALESSNENKPKKGKPGTSKLSDLLRRALVRIQLDAEKRRTFPDIAEAISLDNFVIYAPDHMMLRMPSAESSILPLGIRGEGLLRLLQSFSKPKLKENYRGRIDDLRKRLKLFGWFEDLIVPSAEVTVDARIGLHDRYLAKNCAVFDERSANEGFLYVLFYFTLLMSWRTPKFFAIDNLDNALNPKLCAVLMKQITELAVQYDKQIICTTHNPAILEGLDLSNPDGPQRLFVVRRDVEGRTTLRRVHAPQPQPGEEPVPLSEAFMRGLIGGLPNNF